MVNQSPYTTVQKNEDELLRDGEYNAVENFLKSRIRFKKYLAYAADDDKVY